MAGHRRYTKVQTERVLRDIVALGLQKMIDGRHLGLYCHAVEVGDCPKKTRNQGPVQRPPARFDNVTAALDTGLGLCGKTGEYAR